MIAKVLWQTWLNWCAIKIIYTTSVEQHLRYVLWNWKRSLPECRLPRCGSHTLDTKPEPSDCLLWASPASCPTYRQRQSASSRVFFVPAATKRNSRRPRRKVLRCTYSPFLIDAGAPGEALTGVRGKATALEIGTRRVSEQELALDVQVHKPEHHLISSPFSQIGSAHHWSSNVTSKIFNQIL